MNLQPFARTNSYTIAPNIIDGMEVASLKAIQSQPLLMYPPKYFMYRTLKNYVGNGQQNLHIRGSRLSNPYTMIDYCQKNNSGCIVDKINLIP